MEDSTVARTVARCIAGVISVLVMTIGGCNAYQSKLVADSIAKGANGLDAVCGIAPSSASDRTCSVRAGK